MGGRLQLRLKPKTGQIFPNCPATWRFNNLLLTDHAFVSIISAQIEQLVSINDMGRSWRGHSGKLLKPTSTGSTPSNPSCLQYLSEISDKIQKIDRQHAETPSPDLYNKRISLQLDVDLLSTDELAKLLLQTRHRLYKQGEKAGRLLAVFKSFYSSLYTFCLHSLLSPWLVMMGSTEKWLKIECPSMQTLYVINPHKSIPNIMSILNEYGEISGYKLNYSKSAFPNQ